MFFAKLFFVRLRREGKESVAPDVGYSSPTAGMVFSFKEDFEATAG